MDIQLRYVSLSAVLMSRSEVLAAMFLFLQWFWFHNYPVTFDVAVVQNDPYVSMTFS